jgi:Protein of unknown function (DUF2809)
MKIRYAFAVFVIIILGISSRIFSSQLPAFIADNTGDMLWAAMVYVGFRCFFLNKSLQWAFYGSLIFSYAIEFSQLYQADWIIMWRHTTLGALVLGKRFLMVDLIRYLLGITIVYLADRVMLKHALGRPSKL